MPHGLPIAALKTDAEKEIRTILGGCSSPPKGEVDCVAQIIVNGVPAIAKAWAATLTTSSCKLTMHGVFCHGSPMVDHPPGSATNRCELADLLVVMDVTTGTTVDRTAALVQAKMDKGGSVAIGTGTPTRQLTLYKGWPTFAFASAAYHGRHRDFPAAIRPKIPTDAGRYGAIDLTLGSEDWRQLDPTTSIPFSTSGAQTLGDFLAQLADAQPHNGVDAIHCTGMPPSHLDDWSFTVAELLHVTYAMTHRAISRAGGSGQRGVTALVVQTASGPNWTTTILGGGASTTGPPGRAPIPAGISIIHCMFERP